MGKIEHVTGTDVRQAERLYEAASALAELTDPRIRLSDDERLEACEALVATLFKAGVEYTDDRDRITRQRIERNM